MERLPGTSSSTGSIPLIPASAGACRGRPSRHQTRPPRPSQPGTPPVITRRNRNWPPAKARRQQARQRERAYLHGIGSLPADYELQIRHDGCSHLPCADSPDMHAL